MADKIITSISYIRTVIKKKTTIEKILAHLSKSEICDKTWSTESLKVLLSDMTAKNQIELVDSGCKILSRMKRRMTMTMKRRMTMMTTAIFLKTPTSIAHLLFRII